MFSRRILRIKAMQYLFAFFKQLEAIDELAIANHTNPIDEVTQKQASLQGVKQGLEKEVKKIENSFVGFLKLLLAFKNIDQAHAGALLTPPPSNLGQNYLLKHLENHPVFRLVTSSNTWPEDLAQNWYYQFLKKHPIFIDYANRSSHTHQQDEDLVIAVLKKIIFKNKAIYNYVGLQDICWTENALIVQRLLLKFIKELTNSNALHLLEDTLSLSSTTQHFYEVLTSKTISDSAKYETYIAEKLENWDITRIAFLDKLLIKMSLAELAYFEQTPKSVIINEYIAIAQKYSTPKSYSFINGMVESLSAKIKPNQAS
ncbi:MAG: transcription antitermination factor NusB [Bacteroidota bacterium]